MVVTGELFKPERRIGSCGQRQADSNTVWRDGLCPPHDLVEIDRKRLHVRLPLDLPDVWTFQYLHDEVRAGGSDRSQQHRDDDADR